ncbi:MAG: FRG domain-containing protein [Rhizobiales bacterium]|nr:FRG domain-containing protein [Hyphomicrobiales bacterium]
METVGKQKLWSFLDHRGKAKATTCTTVRKGDAQLVTSYFELAKKVAELQFLNRDFVLVFRGQSGDYRNKSGNTSLKPSIMRANDATKVPTPNQLLRRYARLADAEKSLMAHYRKGNTPGSKRLRRQMILRWSLLQHYEICKTPLLDVSHSLRVAASFASDGGGAEGFVFVLGVPNLSGAVTASAEAGLQVVRLASVCPPSAVRPHIQEGYLLGEYPEMTGVDQKQNYKHYEIDFGRRLVAKFRFEPTPFWASSSDFPRVPHDALYPTADPLLGLAETIKNDLGS